MFFDVYFWCAMRNPQKEDYKMKHIIKMRTKTNYSKIPNKLHFAIQLSNRATVFKNKKAYDRKIAKQQFIKELNY